MCRRITGGDVLEPWKVIASRRRDRTMASVREQSWGMGASAGTGRIGGRKRRRMPFDTTGRGPGRLYTRAGPAGLAQARHEPIADAPPLFGDFPPVSTHHRGSGC